MHEHSRFPDSSTKYTNTYACGQFLRSKGIPIVDPLHQHQGLKAIHEPSRFPHSSTKYINTYACGELHGVFLLAKARSPRSLARIDHQQHELNEYFKFFNAPTNYTNTYSDEKRDSYPDRRAFFLSERNKIEVVCKS